MKRAFSLVAVALSGILLFAGCGSGKFEDMTLDVESMSVSSASIDAEGNLYTVTAADKNPNDPKGENKSPHLAWEAIDNAACYAVVMFDTSANWLHLFRPEIHTTELTEGQFTDPTTYIGAYPPKNFGAHEYRLEVFALKNIPHNLIFRIDRAQRYADIVKALDRYDGQDGNVLARGYVVGTYANGDNTVKL